MTCRAAFVPRGDSLSQHLTWQNCASGLGTAQTLSLGGSSLGRLGAPKPLLLHLLDGWPHRDPPSACLVPPTQQEFNQWVGTEGDISLALGQTLL